MASECAYKIARNQLRTVEAMANNLDGAHIEGVIEGRLEGLEEAAKICEDQARKLDKDAIRMRATSIASLGATYCRNEIRKRIEEMEG